MAKSIKILTPSGCEFMRFDAKPNKELRCHIGDGYITISEVTVTYKFIKLLFIHWKNVEYNVLARIPNPKENEYAILYEHE